MKPRRGLAPLPAIRLERIGSIGSTQGVKVISKPRPKNTASIQPRLVRDRRSARAWSAPSVPLEA